MSDKIRDLQCRIIAAQDAVRMARSNQLKAYNDTSVSTEDWGALMAIQSDAEVSLFRRQQELVLLEKEEARRQRERIPGLAKLLVKDDVEWVVNDNGELGVKIGNRFFFLYKGGSLEYREGRHNDGDPILWRPVYKREFGECCHPVESNAKEAWQTSSRLDTLYRFGDDWKPLPEGEEASDETE